MLIRVRGCACDALFINGLQGVDGVRCLLFSEEVDTHIFGDTIQPTGERCGPPVGMDGTQHFQPSLLCQVLSDLSIFDASSDVGMQTLMVFGNQCCKRISIALLRARDEVFFLKIKQSLWFLSFYLGNGIQF